MQTFGLVGLGGGPAGDSTELVECQAGLIYLIVFHTPKTNYQKEKLGKQSHLQLHQKYKLALAGWLG